MILITLYRRDFKDNYDDNSSLFDLVLDQLNVPEKKRDEVEELELHVDDYGI